MNNVEFISYDGEYPCLCFGTLVAKVNGNTYVVDPNGECSHYPCGFLDEWSNQIGELV